MIDPYIFPNQLIQRLLRKNMYFYKYPTFIHFRIGQQNIFITTLHIIYIIVFNRGKFRKLVNYFTRIIQRHFIKLNRFSSLFVS